MTAAEIKVMADADLALLNQPNGAFITGTGTNVEVSASDKTGLFAASNGEATDYLNEQSVVVRTDAPGIGTATASGYGQGQQVTASSTDMKVIADSTGVTDLVLKAGGTTWSVVTAAFTLAVGQSVLADTTAGAFTVTLPPDPSVNDLVSVSDYAGTFSTNNCTLGRNGSNIMGLAEDMALDVDNISVALTYIDATQGWRIT